MSGVWKLLSFFLAALLGGVIALWIGGRSPPPAPGVGSALGAMSFAPQAPVAEVTQMPSAARLKLGGYVEPRNVARLTAQGPGRVSFVAGQEGERMARGQIVVSLDTDALQPEYRSAWAGLSGDMAASQNAQTQLYHSLYGQRQPSMGGPAYDAYERALSPFYNMAQQFMGSAAPGLTNGPGAPFAGGTPMTQAQSQRSYPAINNARADYEKQMAALVASQARIDALDQRLRDRRATAPYASVILTRYVRVGDVVQPGQPLVDLADVDQLDVRIEVPAHLVTHLKIGDEVPVSLSDANVWAPVSQIFPAANPLQHTVTVKLALPNGAPAAPGMYALAWIAQSGGGGQSASAPAVPTSAIAYRGSLPVAFVINGMGGVEMRILRLGEATGDRTAVLSGLQPGERILTNPGPDLRSGDPLVGPQH
jgi:RND family efflux transporter MFP subunit